MSTFAEQLRSQAADMREHASKLEALAAELDGTTDAQQAALGDTRCHAIALAICAELRMPLAVVLSADRRAHVVVVRDICAHAFRCLLDYSLQRVAHTLGKLDHQTVAYALRRVRDRRQVDKRFEADLHRAMAAAHAALAKIEGINTAAEERKVA